MLKKTFLPAALLAGAALWLAAGCTPPPPPAPTGPSNPAQQSGKPAATAPTSEMADTTPVRDAVNAAVNSHANLFPKGTQAVGVTVSGGVAALDFSPEFSQLANMGESVESGAQKQLRAALAKFPEIEKMHVTVKGKPFDSQATDWTTPFPVRLTADEKELGADARDGGAPKDR